MPFESRLRDALERAAAPVSPSVERSLHAVLGTQRRRALRRRAGLALAAGGLVAAGLVVGGQVIDGERRGDTLPPVVAARNLAGSYEVTLSEADGAGLPISVAGRWRMELRPDGVAVMSAPDTFRAEQNALGESFEVNATTFRTSVFFNNFCSSVGTYSWHAAGDQLVLDVSDEPCELRRAVLASQPWTRVG